MQTQIALSRDRQVKTQVGSVSSIPPTASCGSQWICEACRRVQCLGSGLGTDELQYLHKAGKQSLRLYRQEHLFRAGNSFKSIFIVVSGIVKVYRPKRNGEEQILQFCLPGDLVSIDPINSESHSSSAVAIDTAYICKIPLHLFTKFDPLMPNLQPWLVRRLSDQLSQAQYHAVVLATKNVEQKLAGFLIDLLQRFHAAGYQTHQMTLTMSQAEIGNYLSITKETVCRKFAQLESMGIISLVRRQITILDRRRLEVLGLI